MNPANETWTLNGEALTIPLPPYNVWTGTVALPVNSPSGTVVNESDSQNNYDYVPAASSSDPAYGARTKDLFMSFEFSQATTFGTGGATMIPVTLTSTCLTSGVTYFLDAFVSNTFQYMGNAVAGSGTLTVQVEVTPNPFPGGVTIDAVVSH